METPLDSVSAVLAKTNLFKAYQEECSSRNASVDALKKLIEQINSYGCPTIDALRIRLTGLEAGIAELAAASATYSSSLEECLAFHKTLEEMRLTFAKRAEALRERAD